MSTLTGRSNSALLVIDVQNSVVDSAFNRETVIQNINTAVAKARSTNTLVIWVQHSNEEMPIDSDGWMIVSELSPLAGDPTIRKTFRSSFEGTNLEQVLGELNVSHLYLAGAQSNNCVRHTSHSALERGYDVTLIDDAHTTTSYDWEGRTVSAESVINEQNDNFARYQLPGRQARAISTAEVTFS